MIIWLGNRSIIVSKQGKLEVCSQYSIYKYSLSSPWQTAHITTHLSSLSALTERCTIGDP